MNAIRNFAIKHQKKFQKKPDKTQKQISAGAKL